MAMLSEISRLVGGEVIGDGDIEIRRVAPIDVAGEGDLTFLANPKYADKLNLSRASAVLVNPGVEAPGQMARVVCANPYLAFAKALTLLQGQRPAARGVMAGAVVAPSATLGDDVTVHPGCVIGENVTVGKGTLIYPGVVLYDGVTVGEDCVLHANVVVRERCRIGHRVILQPSAIIGSDGFGFAPDGPRYFKIPQVGVVVLEDDVEIGSATCVDRATLGETRVKRGAKIDNLVQIAHNVVVGEDTILVSQVGIAGSTRIGRHCTFGGQAATAGHLSVGDNVTIGARGGVTNDVGDNQLLSGLPVMPHKEWLKASMTFGRLPEMRREIGRMKKQIAELENMLKEK
jgi:UDP-3-O-[3-hydroxymyristoyl] glucosamine N-acyltransferase